MNTKEIKKFLKKNQKTLLIALGVVAVLVILWLLLRRSRGLDTNSVQQSEQFTNQTVTPGMNWNDLARRLRQAFSGPNSSGTDESEVYNVLAALRNQADWEYLKRYWTIYCEELPLGQRMIEILLNGSHYKSLTASLVYELSNSELSHCREILNANGIIPDF